jgi:hypothetical protein
MIESVRILMYGVEIWGWMEQEEVEGVQEKYLRWVLGVDRETPGYNERTTDKAHIREIVKKANEAMACVWGIKERKSGDDFRRGMMMFENMVESIVMYL